MAKRPNEEEKNDKTESQSSGSGNNKSMPGYLQAAARIATSYPLGAPSTDDPSKWSAVPFLGNRVKRPDAIPGYVVFDYLPTLGVSRDENSALNRAAYNSFNTIRSQISGKRDYEPSDFEIARAAVTSMHDLYYYVRRIYGIVRKYSATNLYRPRMALTAMGLDADDWIANAAPLYQWLLDHRTALTPFPTVKIGDITDRHLAFNTFMFTDGSIESVQTYIFNQKAFWSYEEVDQVKGLTPRSFPTTYTAFTAMWDEMYAALQLSTDIHVISADIRRAYGDSILTELPDTPSDYVVEYIELDPIKISIMNATIIGSDIVKSSGAIGSYNEFRIYDDHGVLKCEPTFELPDVAPSDTHVVYMSVPTNHINSVSSAPEAAEVVEAIRLKPVIEITENAITSGAFTYNIISMGSEVVIDAHIVGFNANGGAQTMKFSSLMITMGSTNETSGYRAGYTMYTKICKAMSKLANFDWHPPIATVAIDTSDTENYTMMWEDVQNYIPISDQVLKMIHDANLLAQFNV